MKLITPGVVELATLAASGEFPGGNYFGAAGLAPFHDFEDQIPAELKAQLEQLAIDLKEGTVKTGYNPQ
jgi:basic membrane protein A